MRISIITSWATDVLAGSGTAVFFQEFLAGLRERGFQVEIIAPNFDTQDYIDVTLQRFLFNTQLRTDPRIHHADVLIGFDYDGYGLDPTNRPPLIASAHALYGDVVQWESGPVKAMVMSQAFFDRVNMQNADHVTVGSEYGKRRIAELYGIPPEKITAIPHGMATPPWMPLVDARPRTPNNHPVVLAVGKMYPRKRVDLLVRAMPMLIEKYPTIETRIVGNGLEYENVRALSVALGVDDHMTWLSHVADDEVFAHEWRQADVFCHPSSQETFGYVYLEAMRLGKPIVATTASTGEEVIGDAGILVAPNDPAAIAHGIDTLLANPALREELSRRGRQRAARYTTAAMIDGYAHVIEQVMHSRYERVIVRR